MAEQNSADLLSLPQGGGAVRGLGETFQPDLHMGTATFGVPLELPAGRGGLSPTLALTYNSGFGRGKLGLGWQLAIPGVRRRTDKRVPAYDGNDVFVLSGAEDLVPVPGAPDGVQRYRPRTENLFARIEHHTAATDHWVVWTKDGLRSTYGTARPTVAVAAAWADPAVITDPERPEHVLEWLLTRTVDTFGNTIAYTYQPDPDDPTGPERYLERIQYADYGDPADPAYLVQVRFTLQDRSDRHSDRRGGFPVRTGKRYATIETWTNADTEQHVRTVALTYQDAATRSGGNGASLLTMVTVTGHDGDVDQSLPPLEFEYSGWEPAHRRYQSLSGMLPTNSLAGSDLDLVDLDGTGLPDVLQLSGGVARYWRNNGDGEFAAPRTLRTAPAGVSLGGPGVQLLDAEGDGRPDLLVSDGVRAGYYPLARDGAFDATGYVRYQQAPSFGLSDPMSRLIDLDGDGITDAIRNDVSVQVYLNRPGEGWSTAHSMTGSPLAAVPFDDPRVRCTDMTGDGLTDVVLIRDRQVTYWPNLGHGRFGDPVVMTNSPRFPDRNLNASNGFGFDPSRLLLGDVDGDGLADLVYVGARSTTVWINRAGEAFADPVLIPGTPQMDNAAAVRLADIKGTGTSGVLWTYPAGEVGGSNYKFLDLTDGKPYLLTGIDNHMGASTTISYAPSTKFALADAAAGKPWRTTLPFPVQVVDTVITREYFSGTNTASRFTYGDGYWDPGNREFRGFGFVEHTDTVTSLRPDPPDPAVLRDLDPLTPATPIPAGFDPAQHGNLLRNWSFDMPRDGQPITLTTTTENPHAGGISAAAEWTTWNNFPTTTTTDLQPSTLPQGRGGSMLHVSTGAGSCGIVQTFLPQRTGPTRVVASAWVYVVSGSVVIGTGEGAGGNVDGDAVCDRTGRWTLIQAGNHRTPANEFIIYSASGAAEFYVDHAWIHATDAPAAPIDAPPVRTATWFHLGPVGPAAGNWTDLDPTGRYWHGDSPLRPHEDLAALPAGLPRPALREALRGLRGRVLRTEVYADDGDPVYGARPYEVHDSSFQVVPVLDGRDPTDPTWLAQPVVTVRETLSRQTIWDRGDDPMTRITATGRYDDSGRPHATASVGVPRGRDPRAAGAPCLATVTATEYATRDDTTLFRLDRACSSTRHEAIDPGTGPVTDLVDVAIAGTVNGELRALEFTYYDGPAFTGLDLGHLGDHGLPVRAEHLVITAAILNEACQPGPGLLTAPMPPYLPADGSPPPYTWTTDYPDAFRVAVQDAPTARGPHLGYQWHSDGDGFVAGYYTQASRLSYDVHTPQQGRPPRGLALVSRDAYGGDTSTGYDDYELLPLSVTDPVGLTTTATYDYRVVKPLMLTDPNANRTRVGYTPLGLPAWVARLGKDGQSEGDTADQPALRYRYNLNAFDESASSGSSTARQPISVATTRRVEHRWKLVELENTRRAQAGQPPLADEEIAAMFGLDELDTHPDRFIRSVEFTDGLGRPLQTRTQADDFTVTDLGLPDDLSPAARTITADNGVTVPVVVSGWNLYDNKGHPVVTYEPFMDAGYDYLPPESARLARLAWLTQHYDARGRKVRTVAPDGSETRVVFGEFVTLMSGLADVLDPSRAIPTPWETYTYDPNDNAGRTHPTSTLQLNGHWNTPSSVVVDPLGRTIRATECGADGPVVTQHTYDIDGHPLTVTDPLGRLAASTVYDLTGQPWRTWLLDAGTSHLFRDTTGAVIEHRDDKGALELTAFDISHRPVFGWAGDNDRQHPSLRTVTVYGDDTTESGLTTLAAAREINALGRPVAVYDEAGQVTTAGYDLDSNPISTTRRVLRPDLLLSLLPPTGTSSASWEDTSYPVDWQPSTGQTIAAHAGSLLDETHYQVDASFDALSRRTRSVAPVDATGARARLDYTYGRGGGITTITLDDTPYLRATRYDAHGRRVLTHLGNGILLRYRYDTQSQRLRRLRAEHTTQHGTGIWVCDGPVLQDYTYRYDPAGNIITLGDRTPGCGIPPGDHDSLDRQFSYDPLHRLLSATGRETDTLPDQPWLDIPRSQDITLARAYSETYRYDPVGNLIALRHATDAAGTGAYTRTLTPADASNRLATLTVGSLTASYGHDPCGNMIAETTSRRFEWDHANRMATFRTQAGPTGPSLYVQYRYDQSGQRLLKVTQRASGSTIATIYLGLFERTLRGIVSSGLQAYDEIQVVGHTSRIASVRRGNAQPNDSMPDQPVLFQLDDHISSVSATLSINGNLLNREEYTPYGETSLGSYVYKRYRFTGKQRDEEHGLTYHVSRYYASWLSRWMSCDPIGHLGGQNLYSYCRSNPNRFIDQYGTEPYQPHLIEQTKMWDATSNRSDIAHKEQYSAARKNLCRQWGEDPEQYAIGHDESTPHYKSPAGGKVKVGPQSKRANAEQSVLEGKAADQLRAKGGWLRNKRTDTGAPAGKRYGGLDPDVAALAKPKGFVSVDVLAGGAGLVLTGLAVYSTTVHMQEAYAMSRELKTNTPLVEQGIRETGSWGGGFLGGYVAGAALGVETGPGLFLTGLIGGIAGSTVGKAAAQGGIDLVHEMRRLPGDLMTGLDALVVRPLSGAASPWGNW